jgi:hypothetical protein
VQHACVHLRARVGVLVEQRAARVGDERVAARDNGLRLERRRRPRLTAIIPPNKPGRSSSVPRYWPLVVPFCAPPSRMTESAELETISGASSTAIFLPRAVWSSTWLMPCWTARYRFVGSSLWPAASVAAVNWIVCAPDCSSTLIVRPPTFPRWVSL